MSNSSDSEIQCAVQIRRRTEIDEVIYEASVEVIVNNRQSVRQSSSKSPKCKSVKKFFTGT